MDASGGTHVHEVSIDRGEEPASANTWTGISQYFSFSYKYDDNGDFKELTAQEQRGLGSTTKLSTARIARLWKGTSSTFGTGFASKFQVSEAAAVEALPEKKKTGQVKKSTKPNEISETENLQPALPVYSECDKPFLRPGNINRHKGSATCKRRKGELGKDIVLATSIKKAKQLQTIHVEKGQSTLNNEIAAQDTWANQIQGSALKSQQPKKTVVRFSESQISIMVECYKQGRDKGKRFTPKQCQTVIKYHPNILATDVLTENQIKSFWNRYHRGQNKHTTAK